MISKDVIQSEIEFYKTLNKKLKAELQHLPVGSLFFKQEHGRKRPYAWIGGKEKYLKHDSPLINKLLARAEIEQAVRNVSDNAMALTDMLECFQDLDKILPSNFSSRDALPKEQIAKVAETWGRRRKVNNLPVDLFLDKGDKKGRQFKTSDGIFVKSKSELVIYEYLKLHGIPFLYENPTLINGKTLYPDFTILRPTDGRKILWEHFGMMEQAWYKDNAQGKLLDYSCDGYWPFKNLITTFEFRDGDLDISEIERILVMMEILPA